MRMKPIIVPERTGVGLVLDPGGLVLLVRLDRLEDLCHVLGLPTRNWSDLVAGVPSELEERRFGVRIAPEELDGTTRLPDILARLTAKGWIDCTDGLQTILDG